MRAGLSQKQVADKLGVQPPTIFKWEREMTSPTVRDLERLSAIYDVAPDALFHDPDAGTGASGAPDASLLVWSEINQIHPAIGFYINMDWDRIDEGRELNEWVKGFRSLVASARQHVTTIIKSYPPELRCDAE
jgi:transcriptional regulator with XRE-family HTH domain